MHWCRVSCYSNLLYDSHVEFSLIVRSFNCNVWKTVRTISGFGIIVATIHIWYKIMCPSFFATYVWWFLVEGQLQVSCICMERKVPFFNFRWLYIHRNQQRKHYIGFILLGNYELMQGCLLSTLNFSFMLFCNITQKSNIHKKPHENIRFKIYNLKHRL